MTSNSLSLTEGCLVAVKFVFGMRFFPIGIWDGAKWKLCSLKSVIISTLTFLMQHVIDVTRDRAKWKQGSFKISYYFNVDTPCDTSHRVIDVIRYPSLKWLPEQKECHWHFQ